MAEHNTLGIQGEEMAVRFLRQKGFEVLERNWRKGRGEVDIIAQDGDVLVFVEVKTRTGRYLGLPEEFVTPLKIEHMLVMAALYMEEVQYEGEIRFDIIGIWRERHALNTLRLRYFPDAFFPGWGE